MSEIVLLHFAQRLFLKFQKAGRLADNPKRRSLVGGRFRKGNIALRGFPKGRAFWWLWSGEKKR